MDIKEVSLKVSHEGDFVNIKELNYLFEDESSNLPTDEEIIFTKFHDGVIIPHKLDEDAGYDLYLNENNRKQDIVIHPNTTKEFEIGLGIACSKNYFPKICDRGSIGSEGLHITASVGDSGYRGEYFISMINPNYNKWIVFTEDIDLIENRKYDYYDLKNNKFVNSNDDIFVNNKIQKKMNELKYSSIVDLTKPHIMSYIRTEGGIIGNRFIKIENIKLKNINKAICQFVLLPVPTTKTKVLSLEEFKQLHSLRGEGKKGSTNK